MMYWAPRRALSVFLFPFHSLFSSFCFSYSYYSPTKNSKPVFILFKPREAFSIHSPKFLHALQATGKARDDTTFSFLCSSLTTESRMDSIIALITNTVGQAHFEGAI
jgi:hypothetical protein